MNSSSPASTCPHCSSRIPSGAPAGLCPRCVLTSAATPTDAGQPPGQPRSQPPSLAEVASAFPALDLLALIGTGGMGCVYHARERASGREVALKILPRHLAADPIFVERFDREARTLARLDHPNIVRIYGHGQSGGFCHLTMEYVDGANLRQAMRAGRFTPAQALTIVPVLCDAIHYAHSQGVLHRDIKPENILLDSQGQVKIADFGIAKLLDDSDGTRADITLTQTGHRLGTPHYMAPEQVERPADVDHRADIYSLGVVFYELLTGELPLGRFPAPSTKAYIDSRVDDIVFRALAKERELRQQSAGQVKDEVEGLNHHPRTTDEAPIATPLRTALCFRSTPEHLRAVAGQAFLYTDSGTLVLEPERLVFSGNDGVAVFPLRNILATSLGEYPRLMKPFGLSYLAIQIKSEKGDPILLFTPYASQWNATWTTNAVVREWHEAVRSAVRGIRGKAPAEINPAELATPFQWRWLILPAVGCIAMAFFLRWAIPLLGAPFGNATRTIFLFLGFYLMAAGLIAWQVWRRRGASAGGWPATLIKVVALGFLLLIAILLLSTTFYMATLRNPAAPTVALPTVAVPGGIQADPYKAPLLLTLAEAGSNPPPGAILAVSSPQGSGETAMRSVRLGDGSIHDITESDFLSRLAISPTNQHPAIGAFLLGPALDPKQAETRLAQGASLSRSADQELHELQVDLAGAFVQAGKGRFDLAVPPLHALLRVLPADPDRRYFFLLPGPDAKRGPDFHEELQSRNGGLLAILVVFAARAGDTEALAWAQAQGRALWTPQTQLQLCQRRLNGDSDQDWEAMFVHTADLLALPLGGQLRITVIHRTKTFGVPPRTNVVDLAWPRLP